MKIKVIGAFVLLLSVLIAACQSEAELDFKRYYGGGMQIYKSKCQNCHGAGGEGLSNLIPPLTDTVYLKKHKALISCFIKYGINETIITINGKAYEGAMPSNTDMTPIDVAKVLTYVGNSFGNKVGIIPVDEVDADLAKCK